MSDFPTAAQMRAISDENKNIVDIQKHMNGIINRARDYIETASKHGRTKTYIFLNEGDNSLNLTLANALEEFLSDKGYELKTTDNRESVVICITW